MEEHFESERLENLAPLALVVESIMSARGSGLSTNRSAGAPREASAFQPGD